MSTQDLIGCAEYLISRSSAHLTQSDIKRAVSKLYYAIFNELASTCADIIAGPRNGSNPTGHTTRSWTHCYRALQHGLSFKQCEAVANMDFPVEIKNFAEQYTQCQEKRIKADYVPNSYFDPASIPGDIQNVRDAIKDFSTVNEFHKRAFARLSYSRNHLNKHLFNWAILFIKAKA